MGGRRAAAPAPFSPLDIADLEAWYRETYASGTWVDLSGKGRDLTQATAGSRPTQVARAGQAALSFDGGDWVQGAFGATLSQPLTVYAVFEPTSLATQRYIFDGDDASNRVALYTDTTPNYGVHAPTARTGGTPTLAIHAACFTANGASSALRVDNFAGAAITLSGDPGTAGLDGLTVGARYLQNINWQGYIWEIILYSGAHNAATRKLVGDYLTARYTGLTVTT